MSRVKVLVDDLRLHPSSGETYNQTAVIPMLAYYKLQLLGEHLVMPRSRLAGMLLAAALDDAIAALPDTDQVEMVPGDERSRMAVSDYINYEAASRLQLEELESGLGKRVMASVAAAKEVV